MSTMHDKCSELVYIDLSGIITLISRFCISPGGLKVGMGTIKLKSNLKEGDVIIYCMACDRKVEMKELLHNCFHCGKLLRVLNLFYLEKSGGVYCENCCKKYFSDERGFSLSTTFSKKIII